MKNEIALKVYDVDYSFIIKNYLASDLWQKTWTLFVYKNVRVTLDLYKIEVKKHTRKRKSKVIVSEEELRECVEKGMRTKDIADFFGITSSNLCHLKQKYGIASRGYNRK